MIRILLPDGSERIVEAGTTVFQVAESIGKSLAKAAIAAKVNGRLVDLSYAIYEDISLIILTDKTPEALEVIRHSTAHLLAHAVKELFPDVQITIGPVIENGFYYDFAFHRTFTPDDLIAIESKMNSLVEKAIAVRRVEMSREQAIQLFEKQGEHFKVQIIQDIPQNETLSFYQQDDFIDLCRGPHVNNTEKLKYFKLLSVAGAYWRGDSNNQMLQRIYGTAFTNQKDLDAYLFQLEEAEKRGHQKIAKVLDLYHIQEEAPGMIFWHPNGWVIYQTIEKYMTGMFAREEYRLVRTPQIVDISLWEKSGHWAKFQEDMFSLQTSDRHYAIKPMNCPCHVQIYNQGLKSYRDLPLRLAEFGSCHRNESSGALHGLFRTRNFTQDDAHIFCTEEQIESEIHRFINFLFKVYQDFGFQDISVKLSTRPEKRVGTDEIWDKAEKALENVLNDKQLDWQLLPGEGAFYGPKIEFVLKDAIGRFWTTGSVQLDFSMPGRLGAEYVAEDGSRQIPVMLHRAIFGSLERFIGILLEHHGGFMPTWLSPTQVVILTITEQQCDYAKQLASILENNGIRVKADLRNEKVSYKIREHTLQRVPYMLIIGDKEKLSESVTVRLRDGTDLGHMSLKQFLEHITQDIAKLSHV